MPDKNNCAPRPPMGWNSWDCYGAAVNEEQLLGNAEYMRDNLKEYGWEYVVCDIQWSEPTAVGYAYNNFVELYMDEYSRLIPAVNRFPSSADGVGFKATRKTRGIPFVIPPKMPPAWLVFVITFPSTIQ